MEFLTSCENNGVECFTCTFYSTYFAKTITLLLFILKKRFPLSITKHSIECASRSLLKRKKKV